MGKNEVHTMYAWNYAYRAARKDHWCQVARDRERFGRRIEQIEEKISYVLSEFHRQKILEKMLEIDI